MIDTRLDPNTVKRFCDDIADRILVPKLADALAAGRSPMLASEKAFYADLQPVVRAFVARTPAQLEATFDGWLRDHPDYLCYASGSLTKFKRHLSPAAYAKYDKEWAKHDAKSKSCKCKFCKVSKRAAGIFEWKKFSNKPAKTKTAKQRPAPAAEFVRAVGLAICPYCSRNYVSPISDATGDVYRPDLDHFFAKSVYPYFALCLYNLVPSCAACNCRIKGDEDFLKAGYFHPYADPAPDRLFCLVGTPVMSGGRIDPDDIEIEIDTTRCAKSQKSADFFKLKDAYGVHKSEIADFVTMLRHYPDKIIEERAKELKVDAKLLKLLFMRTAANDAAEYKKRPLGKLYHDLYQSARS
jgi:hypothetical protein